MRASLILAIAVPLALAGCAGDPLDEHLDAQTGPDTDAGLYHLQLEPSPNPPTAGDAALRLTLTDNATDAPVTGASILMNMRMSEHEHGMDMPPMVTDLGGGVYSASWTYPMTGYWEMTLTVDGAAGEDQVVVGYEVE